MMLRHTAKRLADAYLLKQSGSTQRAEAVLPAATDGPTKLRGTFLTAEVPLMRSPRDIRTDSDCTTCWVTSTNGRPTGLGRTNQIQGPTPQARHQAKDEHFGAVLGLALPGHRALHIATESNRATVITRLGSAAFSHHNHCRRRCSAADAFERTLGSGSASTALSRGAAACAAGPLSPK